LLDSLLQLRWQLAHHHRLLRLRHVHGLLLNPRHDSLNACR
jgi:hypothetical protein